MDDGHLSALLRRCAERDESALKELFDQTSPALYTYFLRRNLPRRRAEMLTSDLFVRVWNTPATQLHTVDQPAKWLMLEALALLQP